MVKKINKKQARSELKETLPSFDLVGKSNGRVSDADITAQLVMLHLHTLEDNLNNRKKLERTYGNNVMNSETLPGTVAETVHDYLNNQINMSEAKKSIQNASAKYSEVLKNEGVYINRYD